MGERAIVPTKELATDRHTAALYRLAAVGQYLYDVTGGDNFSSEQFHRSPLPEMATEKVGEAQRLLHEAWQENAQRAGKALQSARKHRRRSSKNGVGVRIYAVPSELTAFERDFKPSSPESESFMQKVRAKERLERRAAA